jgi:hypothetical protein
MLLDIRAENTELAPGSYHAASEGVAKSECRQLGNAVGWRSGRAGVEQGRRKTNQSLLMSTPILDPSLPCPTPN